VKVCDSPRKVPDSLAHAELGFRDDEVDGCQCFVSLAGGDGRSSSCCGGATTAVDCGTGS
jgi:hypothetical protein